MKLGAILCAGTLFLACVAPERVSEDALPRTAAEVSDFERTSTTAEVGAFLDELEELPFARRLKRHVIGETPEGRELELVVVGNPPPALDRLARSRKLRLFVNANIHGGEVEGKEAVQMILRELANGRHEDLLDEAVLLFVPVYNADGNDRIDLRHRVSQNGPDGGVGERANAQGLDLNRDFLKVDSPEARALLGVFRTADPHLFMDLHTTNGSYHGYHLTYAPSLSTNVDPELDVFERGHLIPTIREAMLERHGFRVFDYGNFGEGSERTWSTYDHRPRFGTNYYTLRGRLSLLSEAYSYLDFETRVRVTRAFVLETLRAAVGRADEILAQCDAADAKAATGELNFGWNSDLATPVPMDVLVGDVHEVELEGLGTRRIASPEFTAERVGVRSGFVSQATRQLPFAWAISRPSEDVRFRLDTHGIEYEVLESPRQVLAAPFTVASIERAEREYQSHHEVAITGAWQRETQRALPVGALIVTSRQRLSRVAAQLLEPESEDSLTTWNFFDQDLEEGEEHPVLRLVEL